jgi:scyllo-inositol 2-dehydrogenase (NADP+)
VVLESGSLVRDAGPRMQAHGTLGSFSKSGIDPQEDALKRGMQPGVPGWGEEDPVWYARLSTGDGDTADRDVIPSLAGDYAAFYRGMRDAIQNGAPPPVAAADALDVIRIIELAAVSHAEQRVVAFSVS